MRLVVVTGLSGAGKSTALRALEDVDYFCMDNVPLPLLGQAIELLERERREKVALVADARSGAFLVGGRATFAALRASGHPVEILFLDAPDESLLRRYSETRRRHPLAGDDLRAGILRERQLLAPLREDAEAIVDTANLNVHQLKGIVQERYGRDAESLSVTLLSFGYKHGLPAEADVVLDVRWLPNPYFVESLSAKNGKCEDVARFVLESDAAGRFLEKTEDWLAFSLPHYEREGKAYLTVAIGCTGGRHRSVTVAEELGRRLAPRWSLTVRHRDLERSAGESLPLGVVGGKGIAR